MYLTKLELNLTNPGMRSALRDAQQMHRLISGLFNTQRADSETLFCKRISGVKVDLYIYSGLPVIPERILPGMHLVAQKDITAWLDGLTEGRTFGFQLLTMPYKKVQVEGCRNSRRKALTTYEDRISWMDRKAVQGGFQILNVSESPGERINVRHSSEKGGCLTMDSWRYTGFLKITDMLLFRKSLSNGIGSGKAYGLGMLTLSGG